MIETLKFYCQKILPLVYDDSLSYYETICKVAAKLNEVVNVTNGIPDYIASLLTDENLKDFSIVTLKSDEKDLGTIGIIGPKRMNYSKIISVMRYIQRLIDEGGK